MDVQALEARVGDLVRTRRVALGLGQKEVAELADFSVAHLSRIESGDRSPSIATLATLAEVLGVPMGALLPGLRPSEDVVVKDSILIRSGDLTIRPLSNRSDSPVLPVRVTVPRGREWGPHVAHPGEEWIFVLSGILVVRHGGHEDRLEPGDSIHFSATEPHRLEAMADVEAIVLTLRHGGASDDE